ncbi:restriction endonuclease subunit S [Shewanella algae]|uniref:restriction endonuclease subunit S n=1 Tax=Shewanella algae TaxID=38313 RepID=UPI00300425C1
MSNQVPEGWNKAPLNRYVTRIRTPLDGKPENVLTISSTAGWVDQREKWARNMAGESLKKYTCLTRGELSYNRGNSKTFPYGCVFKLNRWSSAAVPNVYHSFRVIDGKADPDFVQYAFHGGTLDYQLRQIITSSARANGLLNITAADFFEIELVAPPLPEQRKIAKILTSVDEVIEKTQAQIDKLKDLKTGMMQELLTQGVGVDGKPHTEFKDSPVGRIPKAWTTVCLSEVGKWKGGGTPSKANKDFWKGTIPWVSPKDMKSDVIYQTEDYITEEAVHSSSTNLVSKNSLLMVVRSGILKHTLPIALAGSDLALNQDMKALSTSKACDVRYIFHYLQANNFKVLRATLKAGNTVESIDFSEFGKYAIPFPSLAEQKLIAGAVDSVLNRINAGQAKLNSLVNMKKALMQDLLTGKVRVAID